MVGCEASPDIVTDDGGLESCVCLNAPTAKRNVAHYFIEEIRLEDGICLEQFLLFFISLNVSEVRVICEFEGLILLKTSEGNIALDFMVFSQAEGAVWAD